MTFQEAEEQAVVTGEAEVPPPPPPPTKMDPLWAGVVVLEEAGEVVAGVVAVAPAVAV